MKEATDSSLKAAPIVKRHALKFDLTGLKFSRMLVIERAPDHFKPNGAKVIMWKCRCDCGKESVVVGGDLKNGGTKSCGCLRAEVQLTSAKTHGGSRTREYKIYQGMIFRCINPKARGYEHYGGRGISVAPRWMQSFENFIADMGMAPTSRHSIDRFPDPNGNYEPKNCRWATSKQQARNRNTSAFIEVEGQQVNVADAADNAGLSYELVRTRLRMGWTVSKTLNTPARKYKR